MDSKPIGLMIGEILEWGANIKFEEPLMREFCVSQVLELVAKHYDIQNIRQVKASEVESAGLNSFIALANDHGPNEIVPFNHFCAVMKPETGDVLINLYIAYSKSRNIMFFRKGRVVHLAEETRD